MASVEAIGRWAESWAMPGAFRMVAMESCGRLLPI
jgi:hypothetical protein